MKPIKFENIYIEPSVSKPWMIVIQTFDSFNLYGIYFLSAKVAGPAASSGYGTAELDKLAEGAYYVNTAAIPKNQAEMVLEHGPVIDTRLPELSLYSLGKTHSFKNIKEAIECEKTFDKFSTVSIDIYVQVLRVLGAKIGRKSGETINWQRQLIYSDTLKSN